MNVVDIKIPHQLSSDPSDVLLESSRIQHPALSFRPTVLCDCGYSQYKNNNKSTTIIIIKETKFGGALNISPKDRAALQYNYIWTSYWPPTTIDNKWPLLGCPKLYYTLIACPPSPTTCCLWHCLFLSPDKVIKLQTVIAAPRAK